MNGAAAGSEGLAKLKVQRSNVPAITHVDYSARIQTVDAQRNPRLHLLMRLAHDGRHRIRKVVPAPGCDSGQPRPAVSLEDALDDRQPDAAAFEAAALVQALDIWKMRSASRGSKPMPLSLTENCQSPSDRGASMTVCGACSARNLIA